jgi:dihydrofolate reductase
MNIIAAVCKNRGIGYKNQLPWKLKNEMQYFKKLTVGNGNNAVVMGKNTWLSLNDRPLKHRDNIIISNTMSSAIKHDDTYVLYNKEYSEPNLIEWTGMFKYDKIWIIGGESMYNRFINTNHIDKIFLTEIDQEFECDTFFPHIPSNFKLLEESDKINEDNISYKFKVYKNMGDKFDYDLENHKWCEAQIQLGLD